MAIQGVAALQEVPPWTTGGNPQLGTHTEINGMMDVFVILIVVMGSWYIHMPKFNHVIYFECVQFVICQVHLNKANFNF